MTERKRIRILIAWFCLLTYLLASVGGAHGLAGLMMIMDSSHRLFLNQEYGEVHLVIYHPGNQDKHDLAVGDHDEHEHDSMTNVLTVSTTTQDNHPDHEIHLSNYEQQVTATAKTVGVSENFSLSVAIQLLPIFDKLTSAGFLSQSLPKGNPTLVCLRTTILLI